MKEAELRELITLIIEEVMLERKKSKGRVHFPPEVEKIIKQELKPRYGDNDAAIYGTATKIMKDMGLKKVKKNKKTK